MWYLVTEGDQAIPPDAERLFAKRMGATTTPEVTILLSDANRGTWASLGRWNQCG